MMAAEGPLSQHVVGGLFLDLDGNGFGEESGEGPVLVVEIHQQGIGLMIPKIGGQKTGGRGLATAALGAGGKENG